MGDPFYSMAISASTSGIAHYRAQPAMFTGTMAGTTLTTCAFSARRATVKLASTVRNGLLILLVLTMAQFALAEEPITACLDDGTCLTPCNLVTQCSPDIFWPEKCITGGIGGAGYVVHKDGCYSEPDVDCYQCDGWIDDSSTDSPQGSGSTDGLLVAPDPGPIIGDIIPGSGD